MKAVALVASEGSARASEARRALRLDPRTKVLMLVCANVTLLCSGFDAAGFVLKFLVAGIVVALLIAAGRRAAGIGFAAVFAAAALLEQMNERGLLDALGSTSAAAVTLRFLSALVLQLMPGTMFAYYLFATTKVSEFVAAMERVRLPQRVIIPFAVVFRFFPTVLEEYRSIRDAMRLRGVHASYGKREVLHGVDLDLREGEVAALVGANGAGKSTLCRTIVGLHRESAGTTTIDGEPAGPKQRLRACSMVFQDVNYQLFADSVRTEVSFGLTDAEAPDAARVDEVLDGLGLAAYAERHPATLSGGQKQRLAVAACIATGKRLLVFDEPTSGLDLGSMRTVAALVRRLADEGRAVLVVTHDLEFIGQACDKAVRVEAGRIAAEAVVEGDLQAVRELLAKG